MMNATTFFGESVGRPEDYEVKKKDILSPYSYDRVKTIYFRGYKVMTWGEITSFLRLPPTQLALHPCLIPVLNFFAH